MKNILYLLSLFFLFSCESVDWYSTLEENDNAQEILDQLNDPELKKGKIFVFSQHKDERINAKIRINGEVFLIKRDELQSFELKEDDNSLYTYLVAFGDEVSNCDKEPYVFNSNDCSSSRLIKNTSPLIRIFATTGSSICCEKTNIFPFLNSG